MKQSWVKTKISNEYMTLSTLIKGEVSINSIQVSQTEQQQLNLVSLFPIKLIIKHKIKLKLKRLIEWITNSNNNEPEPFDIKQELKQAKRYFKES